MKKVREYGGAISGINITPIIDVTLVLLIIMLVAAPVLNIPNMDVNLPEAFTDETKEKNVAVSLGVDLRVAVDETIIPLADLPGVLNQKLRLKKDAVVIIRADKDVDYVEVENLIERIKMKTKARRIAVATKQKVERKEAP
jgi:biopolymer transport protein TolR